MLLFYGKKFKLKIQDNNTLFAYRWMATVALATNNDLASTGQLLYRKALFSSHKATNTLLTLLKEAVMLPLPCSNVINKISLGIFFS